MLRDFDRAGDNNDGYITFLQIVECEALKTVVKRDFKPFHKGSPKGAKLVYTLAHDASWSGHSPELGP